MELGQREATTKKGGDRFQLTCQNQSRVKNCDFALLIGGLRAKKVENVIKSVKKV